MPGRGSQTMAKDYSGDERYTQALNSPGDSTVAQPSSQKYEGDNDLHSNDRRGMGETALSVKDQDVPAPHFSSDSDEQYTLQKPFSSSSEDNPDVSLHGTTARNHETGTHGIKRQLSDENIQLNATETFADYINIHVDTAKIKETEAKIEIKMQDFLMADHSTLQSFLKKILTDGSPDFGYFKWEKLHPKRVGELMKYETHEDFDANVIKPSSVFLCRDKISDELFILKKIKRGEDRKRLVGIEFLLEQDEKFLPKLYGVYKESDTFSIFQEYIDGGTLLHCNWTMEEIRSFAEELLKAISFLHKLDLVHFDIKLSNLMLRDLSKTSSLVIIDFESAKRKKCDYKQGGYTINYLPPWHEDLLKLKSYKDVLKTADLWAIACVIIFFLLPGERSELARDSRGVWSDEMEKIQKDCPKCQVNDHLCSQCKEHIKHFMKENGKDILKRHLSHLLDKDIDDPNWQALRKLLEYLTDTNNIEGKHVDMALDLIKVEPNDNAEKPSGNEPGNP